MSRLNRYGGLGPTLLLAAWLLVNLTGAVFAQSQPAQRMDFFRSSSSSLEARWQRLSTAQKAIAYLKRITPLYSWINLCSAVDVKDKSFLMGDCLKDEADTVFPMPMAQLQRDYADIIEALWARNELDAMSFASAVVGEATDARLLRDFMSVGQIVVIVVVVFILLKNSSLANLAFKIRWDVLKRAFFACLAIWLLGGALLQVIVVSAGASTTLPNLQTLVLLIFGGLSLFLGVLLFGRWLYTQTR
jgi:hypothetical protein